MEFSEFSEKNLARCESINGFNHKLDSWSIGDWMVAVTGEVGEAANIIKKLNRVRGGIPGNVETPDQLIGNLKNEIADIFIYLDLLSQRCGFDLEKIVLEKFEITSKKIRYREHGNR